MKGGATGLGWRMFDTLRSRMMALILVSTLGVVALLAYFAVTRIDQAMFDSEKQNAMNLLQSTLLNVENVYRGLVYSDQAELNRRKTNLKSGVDFVIGIVEAYYNEFKQGVHSEKEAKELALAAIAGLKYEERGYFFCFDTNYVPLVHPTMEQFGDLYAYKDSRGGYFFRRHPRLEGSSSCLQLVQSSGD